MLLHDYYAKDHEVGVAFYTTPPAKRIISFRDRKLQIGDESYFLSFPQLVFGCAYIQTFRKDYRCGFFSPTQLGIYFTNPNCDKLYHAAVPNVYRDGHICLNASQDNYKHKTVEDMIKGYIGQFWQSGFDTALRDNLVVGSVDFYNERHLPLNSLANWESKTRNNPNWIPSEDNMAFYCEPSEDIPSLLHVGISKYARSRISEFFPPIEHFVDRAVDVIA
jgi:hypothetical protein